MLTIRKAESRDIPAVFRMINHYVTEQVMLPRRLAELYDNVQEFTVAEEQGRVLGCGSLKFYNRETAEIRSLCVAPEAQGRHIGRALTERLLSEAQRHGLKTLFALTVAPEFFQKCGFREVPRASLPLKVWRDCIHCVKYFHCDEKAVVIDLPPRAGSPVSSPTEPSQVAVSS